MIQNIIRAGFFLVTTILTMPAWTAAQENWAELADAPLMHSIDGNALDSGIRQRAPNSELESSTSEVKESALKTRQEPGPESDVDQDSDSISPDPLHFFGSNACLSDVCRIGHAGQITNYVTDQYCQNRCANHNGKCYLAEDGTWVCDGCGCDVQGRPNCGPHRAVRFGWWAVQSSGSPVKVGEYQALTPSPFYDLDGIWSNGLRTFDYTLSGLDPDTNDARAYYYAAPELSIKFDYQRFLHRLDHEPLAAFDLNSGPPAPDDKVVGEDLNVGEDYAIRVQQLDARFQGELTNNLKWRLDLWGMRKSGERQANAMAHCFNINPTPADQNNTCHVLSQRQSIDWTTLEVKPVVEARVGSAVVEYSRTMRGFGQNDQVETRTYSRFNYSAGNGIEGPPFVYAWVPENFTQIDRIKISQPINLSNQIYANLYVGNTKDKFRDTNRNFSGYDLRLINRAIDGVTLTAFANVDAQNSELPTTFLTSPPFGIGTGPADRYEPGALRRPVEYNIGRFGIKGRWKSRKNSRLSVAGGYEFVEIARDYAQYETASGTFTQEDTRNHQINIGPYLRVSPSLNTFVRYKGRIVDNPLLGAKPSDGQFNTNQPEQDHGVEIGGTWNPTTNFMTTALFGIENTRHNSPLINFDEDNYPIVFTMWYAPTARWSLTGGYAYFSNWIDQDITIGFRNNPTETTRWNYDGYNQLFSLSSNYAWRANTQMVAGVEWDRGKNVFTVPPSTAGADWSLLPTFSDVVVETTRINMGLDHQFGPAMNAYFRYVHFDFEDLSTDYNSGTTNMFLAGVTMFR